MFWVFSIPLAVLVYLTLGALVAKQFFGWATDKDHLDDKGDYIMVALVAIIGPIMYPFARAAYHFGQLIAWATGMKVKEKSK